MPKPYTLPHFTVVVDTNALYPKDVTNVVSPKFLEKWKECSALTRLSLVIPEVVRGERLYQLVNVAQQLVESASKNCDKISKMSWCQTALVPKIQEIKNGVEQRFDAWIVEIRAVIAPIPYDKIPWRRVANDAIWRLKPFIASTDDKDSEKGFRDCLMLETLAELVPATNNQQVV